MSKASSQLLQLGADAPDFSLAEPDGNVIRRDDFRGHKGLLVLFICNHCPYVKHVRDVLADIGRVYADKGVGIVAINSNDYEAYPEDSPAAMKDEVALAGYTFPYVIDEDQAVAKAYGAACTPDPFFFDADFRLVYRGQLDATRPNSGRTATGKDLRSALDALLDNQPPVTEQFPSVGCGIKWKPGNEPSLVIS